MSVVEPADAGLEAPARLGRRRQLGARDEQVVLQAQQVVRHARRRRRAPARRPARRSSRPGSRRPRCAHRSCPRGRRTRGRWCRRRPCACRSSPLAQGYLRRRLLQPVKGSARNEIRDLLRAPAAAAVGRGRRGEAPQRRARAGRARRQGRHRLRLGGRAPLPRGVLALERARGVPRRRQPADQEHPPRPRHRADPAGLQPSGARRRAHRDARPDLRRPRRVRHRRGRARRRSSAASASTARRSASSGRRRSTRSRACSSRSRSPATTGAGSRCRRATSCRSRSRSRTRRCGSRAAAARRSCWPRGKGIGALTFAFIEPEQAKEWVDEYYALIQSEECVPGRLRREPELRGRAPDDAATRTRQTAIERGIDGAHFFGYSLAHYYVFGDHRPGHHERLGGVPGEARRVRVRARDRQRRRRRRSASRSCSRGSARCAARSARPTRSPSWCERYERGGRRPGDLRAAGRHEQARAHLRVARAVRQEGAAAVRRAGASEREAEKRERLAEACERALARRAPARARRPGLRDHAAGRAAPAQVIAAARRARRTARQRRGARRRRRSAAACSRPASRRSRAFVRGRSDAQLERTVGSDAGAADDLQGHGARVRAREGDGSRGEIQYELTGSNGAEATGSCGSRTARAPWPSRARAQKPVVTFRMSVPMFARIAAQEVHPAKAMMEGQLRGRTATSRPPRACGEMFGQESLV